MTTDIDLLDTVVSQTGALVAGASRTGHDTPTPCPEFDVTSLVNHLVGWAKSFAATLSGEKFDGDPNSYVAGPDPAAEYNEAAQKVVAAYREGGKAAQQTPVGLLLMEEIVHGWDLAIATGQDVPFSAEAAEAALAAGRGMLKPEFRGPGKSFAEEVAVAEDVSSVDRLVAFLGRDPEWAPAA